MINGQSIVIKGDISGNEDLVIAGRVEGTITLEGRVLTLGQSAHVVGTIEAGSVIIAGRVDGTIEAAERLEILPTAVVDGELTTPKLVMADGSEVRAKIDMPIHSKLRVA
jgi:cytoskeletal protein CcmA (bactofilin family)